MYKTERLSKSQEKGKTQITTQQHNSASHAFCVYMF